MPSSVSSIETMAVPSHAIPDEKDVSDKAKSELGPFPEGGTAAWCTVIGAALVQLCGFGYSTSFGVYQDFYTLQYLPNESTSAISWIGGVNAFVVTSFSIIAGILYDRGYFYHLMICGSILESFSLFMLSFAQQGQYYQIFLAQGIGFGIAQGMMYVPSLAVVSHYFSQRRTLAMSLVAAGSSAGSIVHPIMLNYLFNRDVGFSNGVRISAAFVSALLFISCLLMRTRLEPPKHPVNYLSVGKGIVHDAPFCIMCIGSLLYMIGFYYPLFYFQLDSVKHGNSETFSFYSLVFVNGASLLGRLSAGFIAPHVGVPWLMIISSVVSSVLIISMVGLNGVPSVVVLGSTYGYSSGVSIAMLTPLIAFLTTDFSELGARIGIAIATLGIGSLLGGPIGGALLTSQFKWWQSSLVCGLVALAGCGLFVVMQLVLKRRHQCSDEKLEP